MKHYAHILFLLLLCLCLSPTRGLAQKHVITRPAGKPDASQKAQPKRNEPKPKPKKQTSRPQRSGTAANGNQWVLDNVISNMVFVDGGTFLMGATAEQGDDPSSDEKPMHRVTLSSFSIGRFPVMQRQWRAVMGYNSSSVKGDNLPVNNVSWNDCQDFIQRLNSLTGRRFRLPTEAEWEFAARGGNLSQSYKYAGSNNLYDIAWFDGNSGNAIHAVGMKRRNELGLYDMSGNVWEWCQDWYGPYGAADAVNPRGVSSGDTRVLRGGCKVNFANSCRVSFRFYSEPTRRDEIIGFRLAQ